MMHNGLVPLLETFLQLLRQFKADCDGPVNLA